MTQVQLQHLLDACFYGKRITELMPPLPKGMKPRHIHVIDTIHMLQEKQQFVCVSNVSEALHITTPSVTKLINELTAMNAVGKKPLTNDRRITVLMLTPLGIEYYRTYIRNYHGRLALILETLSEDDCETTIRTLELMYELMQKNPLTMEEITQDLTSNRKGTF